VRRRYIAVSPIAPLVDTVQLMRLARLRQLPVVDDGILIGLLDFPGLVEAFLLARGGPEPTVSDARIARPESADVGTSLGEAASRMARGALGCLPVVEPSERGPRLVGVVTEADLLRAAYAPALAGGIA
jgi:CBS-domain-containing membrane protein